MPRENDKGGMAADIPEEAVAAALEAVEKREAREEGVTLEVAPEGDDVKRLEAELAMSQEAGRKTFEKLKEEHDRHLRAAADLENYKKRAQREREEIQKFGVEKLAKELLPVVDSLDRALAAAPADGPLLGGVKMTLRVLEEALGRFGVKAFSALGEKFDPARHEALMNLETAEQAPGTVVQEHARGFLIHGRLLRPAMVVVAARPAPPGETPAETREGEG
jgi:molecular chaperone GrpE